MVITVMDISIACSSILEVLHYIEPSQPVPYQAPQPSQVQSPKLQLSQVQAPQSPKLQSSQPPTRQYCVLL